MSKLVALDWDDRELRFAVVAPHRKQLKLLGWGGVSLGEGESAIAVSDTAALGKKIKEVLAPFKPGKAKTVLLIERGKVEQFHFSMPGGIPTAELPGMVLNHVMMESPGVTEETPLDFEAVASEDPEGGQHVTAYVANEKEVEHQRNVCKQAGLIPESLQFRPHAACLPYQLSVGDVLELNTLLVTTYHHDAELSLVSGPRIPLARTIRLPEPVNTDAGAQRLIAEIRRTLLLAPQHLASGQTIAEIRLQSSGTPNEELRNRIQTEMNLPCAAYQLEEWLIPGKSGAAEPSAQMAPLIGGLLSISAGHKPLLDFFHPRKPVKKGSNQRTLVLGGLMAVVGLVFGLDYLRTQLSQEDPQLETLRDTKSKLEKQLKKTAADRKLADAINEWDRGSVVWLDELYNLALKLPPGQDVTLSRLSLTPGRAGGGTISFSAAARTPEAVVAMESAIRDRSHNVLTPGIDQRQDKLYPWGFDTTINFVAVPKPTPPAETKPAETKPTEKEPAKGEAKPATRNTNSDDKALTPKKGKSSETPPPQKEKTPAPPEKEKAGTDKKPATTKKEERP